MDGLRYEPVVHLDYCSHCDAQTPVWVWWRVGSVRVPMVGDFQQQREALNAKREEIRRRTHKCACCAWVDHMRSTGVPRDVIEYAEGVERARLREVRVAVAARMRRSAA